MKYSIVIPVYNAAATLRRCVESWLGQTEQDFELILVDDGSTDGSGALCDELAVEERNAFCYGNMGNETDTNDELAAVHDVDMPARKKQGTHAHIRVFHQENRGVSAARNAGIRASQGEFLLFTDSDDYVSPIYLEHIGRFQRETGADLVLCGFHHLYDGADIVKLPGKTRIPALSDFQEDFLSLYRESFLNMPWNKLYRRELVGVFDTSLSLGEDLLFNLGYLEKCRLIGILAEPLCYYIQECAGTGTLSSQKRMDRMALARRVCAETEAFYEKIWGGACQDGSIFTRYVSEMLDECEKLPADGSLSHREKLAVIRSYSRDAWVRKRGREVRLVQPDYRIIWFFLRRDMPRTVYVLCTLRRPFVSALHGIRRIGHGKN
ncbi:MAG: glycosyltransferase [Lachnospiraceae bacterium]|nr:glycosyltransferase [Lachnospiraceae bacterium]